MVGSQRFPIPLIALMIISLLGCCMELDISIPSFPGIMTYFGANEVQVQSTLSLNFFAVCLSGLFYGPLSEAWGRKGLMLFGATCFLVGALGCVFSATIYQLMFWRFIQGLGASSAMVLSFAMISDRYQGDVAASYIGKLNAYLTIFMSAAPIIGSLLIFYFTWQANFIAIAIIALIGWALLMLGLPETKPQKAPLKLNSVFKDYWQIITHQKFILYAWMPSFLVTAYLTFVGNASFYYMNSCQLPANIFAIHQGFVVGSFSLMSFFANKVIQRLGGEKAVLCAMYLCAGAAIMLLFCAFYFPYEPLLITIAMCLFAIGCAFPMCVTFAESLEVLPNLKGTCSAFIMSSRLLASSLAICLTGLYFDGTMKPVAGVIGGCIFLSLILYMMIVKSKLREPATFANEAG